MSVIATQSLYKRFGRVHAVHDLELQVPSGGVYGFLGPNGAGKTTTIRMLLGLIRPDRGRVELFGQDFAASRIQILQRVGALVESPSFYGHLTGRQNLEVIRRLRGAKKCRIDEVLRRFDLARAADRRASEYSLGMQQRLGLAEAMLGEPELLILDEPTNGLDPAGIQEIRDMIRSLPTETGVSIFLSSHLLTEVERVASHVGIIHGGRLLFEGPIARLDEHRTGHVELVASDAEKAVGLIREAGFEVDRPADSRRIRVRTTGEAAAGRLARIVVEGGLDLHHLAERQPSLEEIFMELTATGGAR